MANSTALFSRAQHVIPGGVNSPVRAFNGVGGAPAVLGDCRFCAHARLVRTVAK